MIADALQVPVTLPEEAESGALGAALQALWTHQRGEAPDLTSDAIANHRVPLQDVVVEPHKSESSTIEEN
jgi:sugar (pentulose or hexulose) kinase